MMRPVLLALIALAAAPAPGRAETAPVVVELFTSQSCSSCPDADRLLAELAHSRTDILALDMHVTYWDRLGWKDPYSLPAATERQKTYIDLSDHAALFTPQLVAGGRYQAIGSDRAAVLGAIDAAKADGSPVAMRLEVAGDALQVSAGSGTGDGVVVLVGYDGRHTTHIGGGENDGRTLTEVNVVRALVPAGSWHGVQLRMRLPRPAGEKVAALLQAPDGRVLGAAILATP